MPNDGLDKVDEIYSEALKLDVAQRKEFVRLACGDDARLRAGVESLLAQDELLGSFLEKPAIEAPSPNEESLVGKMLGPYKVEALLGAGGMGTVYRAHDTRLGRAVAIKLAARKFSSRFLVEARAVAALNHPHVCTLYDIGPHYLVMELLEGETLAQRLRNGALPLEQTLRYSIEIADALAAAHARRIIHRDLKPGNIMVTAAGIKVLDFGLAKLLPSAAAAVATGAEVPTESVERVHATDPGVMVGTAAYMSPEQARGGELDARTDLFSLGVVLYEMTTGKRPFEGKTNAVIFDAILNRPAKPVRQLNAELPEKLDEILHKALEKNRELRYQDASDLRADLKWVALPTNALQPHGSTTRPVNALRPPARVVLAAVLILLAALTLATWIFWRRPDLQTPTVKVVRITNDSQKKFEPWVANIGFPLTTDGPRIFFPENVRGSMVIRQVSSTESETEREILPVPGVPDGDGSFPTDSDTRHGALLLTKVTNQCCELWTVPILGGSPRRLGEFLGREGVWSPDGQQIAYIGNDHGQDGCIFVARSDGSESRQLVPPNPSISESTWLRWSPDGTHLRFTVIDPKTHAASLWEVATDGAGLRPLLPGWSRPSAECCGSWTPDGRYFVFESWRDGHSNIWSLRENPGILHKVPIPFHLTDGPLLYHTPIPATDGKSIFVVGIQERGELIKFDAKSRQFMPVLAGISVGQSDYSRDGSWVAYTTYPDNILWRSRTDGTQRLQLTGPGMEAGVPRWSPDGKGIVFAARKPGKPWSIYTIDWSGGHPKPLTEEGLDEAFPDWSPDGRRLAFCRLPFSAATEELAVRILDRRTRQLSTLRRSLGLFFPRWSPDGRYLAMSSKSADGFKIVLFDFDDSKWVDVASAETFVRVAWSRNGRYLYYYDYPRQVPTVCRVRISDHKVEQVVKLADMTLLTSDLGLGSIGLAPDDSPIAVRDVGSQELYALEFKFR